MWKVPLFDIDFDATEAAAVQAVLRSGWLTMGEVSQRFERRFGEFIGVKHALAVSNGTAALHLACLAAGIGPDDEVICPSFTFVACANAILYSGGTPVFADITNALDLNVSPIDIEAKITQKTKALLVVHYAGFPCDMDSITELAGRYDLHIIEDCAHAPGTEYNGKKCGAIGHLGCFSFFSNKNMTTAEGGMITTDSDELAEKIRLLRCHGMSSQTLERHNGRTFAYDVVNLEICISC